MKNNKILSYFLLTFLLLNLSLLAWYIFVGYKVHFHSDSAAKVLLAQEIYEKGHFFPRDWNYVNSDLFVIFGHVIIIPLLAFLPAGFTVHAISGAVFSIVILFSVWFATSFFNLRFWRRIGILGIVAAGYSGFMSENLYGQVSYGTIFLINLLTISLALGWLKADQNSKNKLAVALIVLLSLAYWSNPKRALISYGLPLFISITWMMASKNSTNKKSLLKILAYSLIGAIVGMILHKYTILQVNNQQGAGNGVWLSLDLIARNIGLTVKGLYAQLGGLPLENSSITSLGGLYFAVRFGVATLLLVLIPMAICRYFHVLKDDFKLFVIYSVSVFSLYYALQITTSIPDMNDPIQSSRYLVPGLLLLTLVVFMLPLDWDQRPPIMTSSIILIAFVFISGGYITYFALGLNSQTLAQPGQLNTSRGELINYLKSKNLQYGYAGYWNAGAISVLSDGKVKVRQIVLDKGMPVPMRHLSSNNWYQAKAWQGNTFVMLTQAESKNFNLESMLRQGNELVTIHQFNEFNIYVFKENIAKYLNEWDWAFDDPKIFSVNKLTLNHVGRLVQEPNRPAELVAEIGESGALHYGPYINMRPGRYLITFDVLANYHPDDAIRLDIAAAPDQKIFGELILKESNEPQKIEFILNEFRTIEFRVWSLGRSKVTHRKIKVERLQDK